MAITFPMFKSFFQTGIRAVYNVLENPTFVAEPWYVYPAKHKQSGRVVSVFIFDKTKFETTIHKMIGSSRNSAKNPRVIVSECYELLKFEVSQLAKLKHPQILTLYEALEETKLKFLFVTEAVTDNLQTTDLSKIDALSVQKGLLQIAKGLQFLHNSCSIVHFNLQPGSVFINNQGDWKLAGFRFLHNLADLSPQERENYYIMDNQSVVPFANLNLNFMAPELIVDQKLLLDLGNDIWSLGCLIFYVYNKGENLINCFESDSINDYKQEFGRFAAKWFNHRPAELRYVLKDVPEKMYVLYPKLMARYPHDRITIDQFIESDFFNGSLIKAMWFLDEFSTKSMEEKLIFLQGLLESDAATGATLLSQLPTAYKTLKLLPLLIELVSAELGVLAGAAPTPEADAIITASLRIIFLIGSGLSSLTFQDRVYEPLLKNSSKNKRAAIPNVLSKLLDASVMTRLTLVKNCDVLMAKLNDKQFLELIKTVIDKLAKEPALPQADVIELHEAFLLRACEFAPKLEFPYVKNTFFPLLCLIFKTTSVLLTKLATLETFTALIDARVVDKLIVNEQLLPILKNVKSRDKRIVHSMLQFFSNLCASTHVALDLDTMVEQVLPQCYALAFACTECTQQEFRSFMAIVDGVLQGLVKKKAATLGLEPSDLRESKSFNKLILSQTVTAGSKDAMETAPRSESVMRPRQATTPTAKSTTKSPANRTAKTSTPIAPMLAKKSQTPLTPSVGKKSQTPLTPSMGKKSSMQTPLTPSVGKKSTAQPSDRVNSSVTNNLLSTLNGTDFSKKADDDDDFEDFQQALLIDWNTEMRKQNAAGNGASSGAMQQNSSFTNGGLSSNGAGSRTMYSSISASTPALASSAHTSASPHYPPGFDAAMVLTPTGHSHGLTAARDAPGDLL